MSRPLPKKTRLQSGQLLLGILISIAVFAILAHAVFTLVASSFDLVNFNRSRITARHIAQEKIELIRNLPYDDVATIGGVPNGTIIPQTENISRNGLSYAVKTSIIFIDDPFDFTAPTDTDPEDYKRVRVEVSWEGLAASRKNPIILITDVTAETSGSTTGGTLVILVYDANSQPVPQAQVTVAAPGLVPPVNIVQNTSNDGKVTLPGAVPCDSCYEITVIKAGYSTDRTYSTSEVTNPIKPHASVINSDVTQVSFGIDLVGTISISSVDSRMNNFTPKAGVPFRLRGNKIIGTDAFGQFVYKYDQNFTTDGAGNYNLSNVEWDTYQVLMPTSTSWDISGSQPLQPVSLLPGGTIDFTFAVEPHTSHSLLTIVKEPSQNLIASASARLFDGVSYDQTIYSGESGNPDFGQSFFSGLEAKTYQIQATASGYLNFSGTFDVSGYTVGEVVLTPQ